MWKKQAFTIYWSSNQSHESAITLKLAQIRYNPRMPLNEVPESDDSKSLAATSKGGGDVRVMFDSLHAELRHLAGLVFSEQSPAHTLQPTALVNEVWLKLSGVNQIVDKSHFFALAAKAMRQVLADHARHNNRQKRGGHALKLTFVDERFESNAGEIDLVAFHDALDQLSVLNDRHAKVAELRLLGSLSIAEIAGLLEVNERTIKRDWQAARLWLIGELYEV